MDHFSSGRGPPLAARRILPAARAETGRPRRAARPAIVVIMSAMMLCALGLVALSVAFWVGWWRARAELLDTKVRTDFVIAPKLHSDGTLRVAVLVRATWTSGYWSEVEGTGEWSREEVRACLGVRPKRRE